MGPSRSRRRSSAICWKASTGGCRSIHGVRKLRADCGIVNHWAIEGSQERRLVIPSPVMSADDSLPDDVETLKPLLLVRDAELAQARAEASSTEALVAHLRLTIEKLKREIFGPRSERKARLLEQMELQLEELEAAAVEDELAAEKAA